MRRIYTCDDVGVHVLQMKSKHKKRTKRTHSKRKLEDGILLKFQAKFFYREVEALEVSGKKVIRM